MVFYLSDEDLEKTPELTSSLIAILLLGGCPWFFETKREINSIEDVKNYAYEMIKGKKISVKVK